MSTPSSGTYDPDAILADPNSHPLHRLYAEINIGIRDRGERWAKCADCGVPYQLTPAWDSETVCSPACAERYRRYVQSGIL
jgi:hypothetical protein